MTHLDRMIEHIAREQHGAFNTRQARAAGATDAMIKVRLRSGAWNHEVRSVYTLAAFRRTWEQHLKIATLSKHDAVVAGGAAAALHRLEGFKPCRAELVLPPGANHQSSIARIRRSSEVESTVVDSIAVTTVRQTLFDVAGVVPFAKLRRAAEAALVGGLISADDLGHRYLDLAPMRPKGIADMRAIIDEFGDVGFVPAASIIEHLLYRVLDSMGVPYVRQATLDWRAPHPMNVDALVPSWHLIAEADGRRWHSRVADLERDRERDNVAATHGFHVMRFTYRKLTQDLAGVRALLDAYVRRSTSAA